MPALTIRHSGLVASGHLVRGTGRPGSIGVHVLPGLDLVIIDGFTVRDFDVCILAESPVVLVNCEILRWRQAGIILKGSASWVAFCSFLDEMEDGPQAAAIVAQGHSPVVQANLFQISGKKRHFGIGDPRRAAWNSKNNLGISTKVFAQAINVGSGPQVSAASLADTALVGVTEDSPGFALTTEGSENLRLLSSSPALHRVDVVDLPDLDNRRFDADTKLPVVDRVDNRRAVEYVTAGAHEMSFSLTRSGRIRWLELIGGLSTKPFNRVASGRDGIFHRMPETLSNPGADVTENTIDIQPSHDLAVMSHREALVGTSAAYFKAEREDRVAFQLSAAPSARSDMHGITSMCAYGWVKSRSSSADVLVHRPGLGRAQDRPVFEIATRFQGSVAPNLSLKLGQDGTPGVDVTFVAESAALASLIDQWTRNQRWWFFAWSWNRSVPTLFVGSEDDSFLRSFSTRPFILDPVTEEMVPNAMAQFRPVLDPNTARIWVGTDYQGERSWHGYVDEISIDLGETASRADLTSIFRSRAAFPDASRVKRKAPQMDVVFARTQDLYAKPPSAFVGELSAAVGEFIEIRKTISHGKDLYVSARRVGTVAGWGIYKLDTSGLSTVIEGIPDLRDLAMDRAGHLVLVADDMALSRIDPTEGIRYEIDAPGYDFNVIVVTQDNEYILDDAGEALVLVQPAQDITESAPQVIQPLELQITLASVKALAITDANELYVLEDGDAPRLLRVLFATSFDRTIGLGLNQAIADGDTFTDNAIEFGELGVIPGDAFTFISDAADLTTPEGVVVGDDPDPTEADNADTRFVRSVSGNSIVFDRPLVLEAPASGKQFEARILRRIATDVVVIDGAPLVTPVAMCAFPENSLAPILIADTGARASPGNPSLGVVFALRADGLEVAFHLSTLGVDLSTIRSIAVRENATLEAADVVSLLRSRLTWHMEADGDGQARIKNAAYPGFSDLDLPKLSLSELLLMKRARATVTLNGAVAEIAYRASFGTEPEFDRQWLNDEYENLSELGVLTEDGVLLARQTVARMPYDPLAEVRTDWTQLVTVSA